MIRQEIYGNLLDFFDEGMFDLIAHQANCFHTFGAGIAKEIAERYPQAYAADLETTSGDITKLGNFTQALCPTGTILNIYGQYNIGGIATNYDALGVAFYKINKMFPGQHIGLPLIGCGIAGGEWGYVRHLIESRLKLMTVTIVHFKQL